MKKEIVPLPVFMAGIGASFLALAGVFWFSPLRDLGIPQGIPFTEGEKTAYYMTDRIYQVTYPVNINEASREELMGIPGIGKETAQKIVDYRQRKGNFTRLEQLLEVEGIGEKTLDKLEEYLYC